MTFTASPYSDNWVPLTVLSFFCVYLCVTDKAEDKASTTDLTEGIPDEWERSVHTQ